MRNRRTDTHNTLWHAAKRINSQTKVWLERTAVGPQFSGLAMCCFEESQSCTYVNLSTMPWRRIHSLINHHAVKAYWVVGIQVEAFLTSVLSGSEWSASRPSYFTPRGKKPRYPLDRRLGMPQNRSGRGGEEKISLFLLGIEPRSSSP
jgi:hypothetical protein